ncbi:Hypothetical predicted protein [Cloeon dipterum]|uniref:Uncharacterized protein n=1 Tax=Cloeon dipterum TaxID=197152 RepID=A0A8S1DSP7_9INSE|nr:Hypothetical predicted protein [Cloeon dipterum]
MTPFVEFVLFLITIVGIIVISRVLFNFWNCYSVWREDQIDQMPLAPHHPEDEFYESPPPYSEHEES